MYIDITQQFMPLLKDDNPIYENKLPNTQLISISTKNL
jgi:hypothetical protein